MDDTYDAEKYIDLWAYQFQEQRYAADDIARSRIVDKPAQPELKDEPASKEHGQR